VIVLVVVTASAIIFGSGNSQDTAVDFQRLAGGFGVGRHPNLWPALHDFDRGLSDEHIHAVDTCPGICATDSRIE